MLLVTRQFCSRHKIHHRIIAVLLTIVVSLGLAFGTNLGLTETQAAEYIDNGTWGDNITWTFDGSTLTFRGTGAMPDAKITWPDSHIYVIHVPWWGDSYRQRLKRVVIGEGITRVGSFNFAEVYPNLTSVTLPSTLNSIGVEAFINCKKLQKIVFPSKLKSIEDYAFSDCTKLSNVTLPSSITKIGEGAFFECNGFTSITIPSGVKTINDAFSRCLNLTSVKIMNGATKITPLAFAECYKLKSIELPASVSSIGLSAFYECRNLTKVVIRNRNCKISMKNNLTIPKKAVIYGYRGSPAEKYAKKFGNKFKTISKSSSSQTTKVKKLKITNAPKKLKAGKSKTLKVKVTPTNATNKKVTWKSSNKKYATVNSKGKVTAKKAGRGKTVKITATAKDGSKKKVAVKIKIQ